MKPLPPAFVTALREYRPEFAEALARAERGAGLEKRDRAFLTRRIAQLQATCPDALAHAVGQALHDLGQALPEPNADLSPLLYQLLHECALALTFTNDAALVQEWEPASSLALPPASRAAALRPRVLIADDDRIVREALLQMLAPVAECAAAAHGKEAYAHILRAPPHLLLLDDFMPEMTGLKLLERLAAEHRLAGLQVIMVTASDRPQDLARFKALGASAHCAKPFNPHHVRALVQARLSHL